MEEIWKSVVGYEGLYEASSLGRIRSVERLGTDGRKLKGKILSPRSNNKNKEKGYLGVSLYKNDIKTTLYVHRLVAEAFIENDNVLKNIVNHLDGDKFNNNIENLEWTDSFGNMRHAYINGLLDVSPRNAKECSIEIIGTGHIVSFETQEELSLYLGYNKAWFTKAVKINKNLNKTLAKKGFKLIKYIK